MAGNLKAVVRYEGTNFAGWQVQPRERTVQGEIQDALAKIAGQPVGIDGASRTDAGVHALGQVFSFAWPGGQSPDALRRSLSSMLKPEIRVLDIEPAPAGFHARKSAASKRYAYTLNLAKEPDPFSARYAWRVPPGLNLERLAELLEMLIGEHNFAGYGCSRGAPTHSTVRTVHSTRLLPGGVVGPWDAEALWHIEFHGGGFLYKMIRNMVGTLIDVVLGKLPPDTIEQRLAAPGPYAGYTAPAHGLVLLEVVYPE